MRQTTSVGYSYDPEGNVTSATSSAGIENHVYDSLGRLTAVTYPNSDVEEFTYDANGNRLTYSLNSVVQHSYSYDAADQLTSDGVDSYTYDAAGNLTTAGSDTYSWDWRNRLAGSTVGGLTASYSYDGDDVRVSQTSGGQTSWYLWDRASGLPLLIDDGDYGYVHADGVLAQTDGTGTTDWLLADGLGSIRGVADANAQLTGTSDYAAFGEPRSQTGTTSLFGFAGEQTDAATGHQYLRARYHDPSTGRFLSADTVQPNAPGSQGFNRYSYTANNPATFTDPSGHATDVTVQQAGLSLVNAVLLLSLAYIGMAAATAPVPAMAAGSPLSGAELLRLGPAIDNLLGPLLRLWTASGIGTHLGMGPARIISAALYVVSMVLVTVVLYLIFQMFVLLGPWNYFTDERAPSMIVMPDPALVRTARWDFPSVPENRCVSGMVDELQEEIVFVALFDGGMLTSEGILTSAVLGCFLGQWFSSRSDGSGGGRGEPPDPNSIKPGNLKDVNPKRVERLTGRSAEDIKYEYLGDDADISKFDLKRDPDSGYLVIVVKQTQRVVEVTRVWMRTG